MIPLALFAKSKGAHVTGSDLNAENFSALYKEGVYPVKGHGKVPEDTDILVYSSAVRENNPELIDATGKNIRTVKRAVFLGEITKDMHSVLISGSHGKSTTSVMLADMLNRIEPYNSYAVIGAPSVSTGSGYYKGEGDHIVIEADEYDRSFLELYPKDLIILNIDNDHMDIYGTVENLKNNFSILTQKLSERSVLVYNQDDDNVTEIAQNVKCRKMPYGINNKTGIWANNIVCSKGITNIEVFCSDRFFTNLQFCSSGIHNTYNMLAAAALLYGYGLNPETVKRAAESFRGIKRRMEVVYNRNGYLLIDDYAHHPTEIKSILSAVKNDYRGRIIALFQPHLFSRTLNHCEEFASSFNDADIVMISHIYPARETDDGSVKSSVIKDKMNRAESKKTSVYENFDDLFEMLEDTAVKGDIIVALGAGEVNKVLYRFKEKLEAVC